MSAEDAFYKDLCVWDDENANGISEPGEIRSLEEAGIEWVGTKHNTNKTRDDEHGNAYRYNGQARLTSSKVIRTTDVFLLMVTH